MGSMALIVFFRGIDVGGHRAFRPSVLAKKLGIYDAVNVGPQACLSFANLGLRAELLAELLPPFSASRPHVLVCNVQSRCSPKAVCNE